MSKEGPWHGVEHDPKTFGVDWLRLPLLLLAAPAAWVLLSMVHVIGAARADLATATILASNVPYASLGLWVFYYASPLGAYFALDLMWRILASGSKSERNTVTGMLLSELLTIGTIGFVLVTPLILLAMITTLHFIVYFLHRRRPPPTLTIRELAIFRGRQLLYILFVMPLIVGPIWLPREVMLLADGRVVDGYALKHEASWLPVLSEPEREVLLLDGSSIVKRAYCKPPGRQVLFNSLLSLLARRKEPELRSCKTLRIEFRALVKGQHE